MFVTSSTGGAGIGVGVAATAFGAAFGAFTGNITNQLLDGTSINNLNVKSALKSAGISGGFSLVSFGLGSMVNNAFNLNSTGETVLKAMVNSLRTAGMADTAISAFLSTVFVEMPKWVAEGIVNGTK